MPQPESHWHAAIFAASAVVLCALATTGAVELAIAVVPIALLVSSLLVGCYPGEGTLAWMAAKVGQRRARTCCDAPPARPAASHVGRTYGGLLIARSLCGRAPPCPAR